MPVRAALRIQLTANGVVVAESDDPSLWQRVLGAITGLAEYDGDISPSVIEYDAPIPSEVVDDDGPVSLVSSNDTAVGLIAEPEATLSEASGSVGSGAAGAWPTGTQVPVRSERARAGEALGWSGRREARADENARTANHEAASQRRAGWQAGDGFAQTDAATPSVGSLMSSDASDPPGWAVDGGDEVFGPGGLIDGDDGAGWLVADEEDGPSTSLGLTAAEVSWAGRGTSGPRLIEGAEAFVQGRLTDGDVVDRWAVLVGVNTDLLQAACSPTLEPPYLVLDREAWTAWRGNVARRGPGAVSDVVLAATLLVQWLEAAARRPPMAADAVAVLEGLGMRPNNVARSLRNGRWIEVRRSGELCIEPVGASLAQEAVRAFCTRTVPNFEARK